MFDAFTRLQEPLTLEDVTAHLQRLESEMPPEEYEALARAVMQRLSLRCAARLRASGTIPEPESVGLALAQSPVEQSFDAEQVISD